MANSVPPLASFSCFPTLNLNCTVFQTPGSLIFLWRFATTLIGLEANLRVSVSSYFIFVPIKCDPYGITNSRMETKHNHQGIRKPFSPQTSKEKNMISRFHGIDRHKKYSTISVLNREGQEIDFKEKCYDLRAYIKNLGSEDAVVIEASSEAFYWADMVESKGAVCYMFSQSQRSCVAAI